MAQLAPVCLPISTYTTSSWFSVFQFLSDSLLEPIWEVENSENECVHSKKNALHSPRKHTSQSSLLRYLWWGGRRGASTCPSLGGAGRPCAGPETHGGIHCKPREQRVRGQMARWKDLRNGAADEKNEIECSRHKFKIHTHAQNIAPCSIRAHRNKRTKCTRYVRAR